MIEGKTVKGWAGLLLTLIPLLHFIPVPAVQALIGPVNEILLAIVGAAGASLAAFSPAIVGKNKPK